MSDLRSIVHSDPEIHSGTPVFVGSRVPVKTLLDYLEGGDSLEELLDNYPSVTQAQAIAFLEDLRRALPQLRAAISSVSPGSLAIVTTA